MPIGRPTLEAPPPPWFNIARYDDAHGLDAADWYLNLALRGDIARKSSDQHAFLLSWVRGGTPVVRRANAGAFCFAVRQNGDARAILNGREPANGVEYLHTHALYHFEKRLPQVLREYGAAHTHGVTPEEGAPAGFFGPVDHLLNPRLLSVFARINLALPDKVLLADMADFLSQVRKEFAAEHGPQPYKEAIRVLGKHKMRLKSFADFQLLPLIDIMQWHTERGDRLPPEAALARILKIEPDALIAARRYADLVLDDFILRGWLIRSARKALRTGRE